MRTHEEWQRIMGRQLAEYERIERERNIMRGNAPKYDEITDPLKIHEAMSEDSNEP